jgi:aminoglycoside 3-N-acetyltransferase
VFKSLLTNLPEYQVKRIKALHSSLQRVSSKFFPEEQRRIRSLYSRQKKRIVDAFLSYTSDQLVDCLRSLGVTEGDTLLVHSSFSELSGFRGSISDCIEAFLKAVGPEGNLLMVSLPYSSYTFEYLANLKCFDVRRTPSRMGLISEDFRRRKDVLRSLHPTHPILAHGPRARWIVEGHEACVYPCGFGSPFEKLSHLKGKVLFFNTSFYVFTFYHYLEELVKDRVGFPLYGERCYEVPVIDQEGTHRIVQTYVYSEEAIRRRRPQILKRELQKRGFIHRVKLGNSRLVLVSTAESISCVQEMAKQGIYFYASRG